MQSDTKIKQNPWRKQKVTDRIRVYLVRLWGGGGLWGSWGVWLPVGIVWGGLVALIGSVRGRDHRPGCLDWSWRVGCSHCMSHSWSLLDAVTGCRGMGVGLGRLGTEGVERGEKKLDCYIHSRIHLTWCNNLSAQYILRPCLMSTNTRHSMTK